MQQMKDCFVDVSFTSPPYNDKRGNNTKSNNGHKKYLHSEEDALKEKDRTYYELLIDSTDLMLKKTKKYVIVNIQKIMSNKQEVFKYIGHYYDRIHDIIIWNKSSAQPTGTKHKISNKYEFLIIMYADGNKNKKVDVQSDFMWNVFDDGGKTKNPYSDIHKAVMNKNVSDFIIKEFTEKGDLVMDCFSGMGTTGVSCLENGRKYMGIEMNKVYYDKSIERMNEVIQPNY